MNKYAIIVVVIISIVILSLFIYRIFSKNNENNVKLSIQKNIETIGGNLGSITEDEIRGIGGGYDLDRDYPRKTITNQQMQNMFSGKDDLSIINENMINNSSNFDKLFKSIMHLYFRGSRVFKPNEYGDVQFQNIDKDKCKDDLIQFHGYFPKRIRFIEDISGGNDDQFSKIDNDEEFTEMIRNKLTFTNKSFESDFVIGLDFHRHMKIGRSRVIAQSMNNSYIIIEFDERDKFHQDNSDPNYIAKNIIYDEILSESKERGRNIVILRIKYNSIINYFNKEYITFNVVKLIYSVILGIYRGNISNCYVLSRICNSRYPTIQLDNSIILKHKRIGQFNKSNPLFSKFDLDRLYENSRIVIDDYFEKIETSTNHDHSNESIIDINLNDDFEIGLIDIDKSISASTYEYILRNTSIIIEIISNKKVEKVDNYVFEELMKMFQFDYNTCLDYLDVEIGHISKRNVE